MAFQGKNLYLLTLILYMAINTYWIDLRSVNFRSQRWLPCSVEWKFPSAYQTVTGLQVSERANSKRMSFMSQPSILYSIGIPSHQPLWSQTNQSCGHAKGSGGTNLTKILVIVSVWLTMYLSILSVYNGFHRNCVNCINCIHCKLV